METKINISNQRREKRITCVIICCFFFLNLLTVEGQTIFNEQFDSITGWKYSKIESNKGSGFSCSDGLLSVMNFGNEQGGWFGPVIEKELMEPLDINIENFTIGLYISSVDNADNAYGIIEISLLDENNVPILTIAWCDAGASAFGICNCSRTHTNEVFFGHGGGVLGLKAIDNWFYDGGSYSTINGLVTLKKKAGQITAHYNLGQPIASVSFVAPNKAAKVKVKMLKNTNRLVRDMKIDFIKIEKSK